MYFKYYMRHINGTISKNFYVNSTIFLIKLKKLMSHNAFTKLL
jgi:hypothetical protein